MEGWSQQLLESLVQRAASRPLLGEGELRLLAESGSHPGDWWGLLLLQSSAGSERLMRLANSAAYAGRAAHVGEAGQILGETTVRHQVFLQSLEHLFPQKGRAWVLNAPRWRNALAVAATSAVIARALKRPAGPLFLAGLLHDLGRLVLLQEGGSAYARIDRHFGQDPALLAREEESHLGFDHGLLGAEILQRWGAPPAVASLVRDHHKLEQLQGLVEPGKHLQGVAILALAERIATTLGYGGNAELDEAELERSRDVLLSEWLESPMNDQLQLSQWKLRRIIRKAEEEIPRLFERARGEEGPLFAGPGLWEQMVTRVRALVASRPEIENPLPELPSVPGLEPVVRRLAS